MLALHELAARADQAQLALQDLCAVLAIDTQCVDALYMRGALLAKLGRLDEAILDLTHVLQLDPNHVNASYARAACRNQKGDFNQAIGARAAVPGQQAL